MKPPPSPAPAPAAPSCRLRGGTPVPETRDIVFAPSGKEGPAALPGSGSQEGTAASLQLRRELSFIYAFSLQIYRCVSLCPRQPTTPIRRGARPRPRQLRPSSPSPRKGRQETNINPAPAPARGRRLGTQKRLIFLGLRTVAFEQPRFSNGVLRPVSAGEASRGVGEAERRGDGGEERQHSPWD